MMIQTQGLKNAHRKVRLGPRGNLTAGGCALRIWNRRRRSRQAPRLMPSFRGHAPSLLCHLMPRCADPFRRLSIRTPGCRNCGRRKPAVVGSMVPQTAPLLAPRGPSHNPPPSTPRPLAHQRSRPQMPWLLRRLPRCRMLRLFRRLRQPMLLRQDG